MATVVECREMATVGREMEGEDTSARLMTTLYDLITAIQEVVGAEDDALVVSTMVYLLQSGQLTVLEKSASRLVREPGEIDMAERRTPGHAGALQRSGDVSRQGFASAHALRSIAQYTRHDMVRREEVPAGAPHAS